MNEETTSITSTSVSSGHRRRRGIFLPLLLISLGGVLLAQNAGWLPGGDSPATFWSAALRFWPLLLVIGGLDGWMQGESPAGNTFAIGLGSLFLLENLGCLNFGLWTLVLMLWPLLLVAWGLDLLIYRRNLLSGLLAVALFLAVAAGVLAVSNLRLTAPGRALESEIIRQEMQGELQSGMLSLRFSAGELDLQSGATTGVFVEGEAAPLPGESLSAHYEETDGRGVYSLWSTGVQIFGNANGAYGWRLKVTDSLPLTIWSNSAVGETILDLRGLEIEGLKVEHAVGSLQVTLPEKGGFSGSIQSAVGETIVFVLDSTALEIQVSTALGNLTLPSGYTREGNRYYSPNYYQVEAGQRIYLQVNQAIGQVVVKTR